MGMRKNDIEAKIIAMSEGKEKESESKQHRPKIQGGKSLMAHDHHTHMTCHF
jgi:hypothetical protein